MMVKYRTVTFWMGGLKVYKVGDCLIEASDCYIGAGSLVDVSCGLMGWYMLN